jgi:hypothetical protein
LTQLVVEFVKVKIRMVGIVVCCDDIAFAVTRQQLAEAQFFHASLQHCAVLFVPERTASFMALAGIY